MGLAERVREGSLWCCSSSAAGTLSSLDSLRQITQAFPFPIRKLQTDRGTAFSFTLLLAVERWGIRHRYIQPPSPDQNGKVERSHRVDVEEFWGRSRFASFELAEAALRVLEQHYNEVRFSMALRGRTPAEKLAAAA
jgi:transposase InsO family protein